MSFLYSIVAAFTVATGSGVYANASISSISPTGSYPVGRRAISWTDSSRRDPVDTTRYREISGYVWYPAARSAKRAAQYPLPDEWQAKRIESLGKKLGPEVAQAMRAFTVHSDLDAPVASGAARLPVLLFVPGLSWLASDYSVLVEDLASHGYVVVGISPAGFSDPVMLSNGRVVPLTLGMGEAIGTDQEYVHADALFALKQLRKLNEGFLRKRLNLDHIGAFGHSLGGTTALVLADRDSTVRAAINIDGDAMGVVRNVRPHQPLLLISSDSPTMDEAPRVASSERAELMRQGLERSENRRAQEWEDISSQSSSARRVKIPGTHHLNFEDAALASGLLVSRESRWMKFGSIEPERGLRELTTLVRTFFDECFSESRGAGVLP